MFRSWRAVAARLRALLRSDAVGVRAGFVALLIACGGSIAAGLTLGSITGTLDALPGLLVLVPAAIGMRGNVFGSLGSRLSTAIHTGTFRLSRRRNTVVGQNLAASISLSLSISLVLAVLAKVIAVGFGLDGTISIADFVVISVIGGFLSSVVVMAITVLVANLSVRRAWDLDNVAAPIVTAAGDIVTLPALFLATYFVGIAWLTPAIAGLCTFVALVALVTSVRAHEPILRRIVRESLPILAIAGSVDIVAGLTIEKRFEAFLLYPALLVLVPGFLEGSGALGGILSARIATKLHLGVLDARRWRIAAVAEDILLVLMYAVPVFLLLGISADISSALVGLASPGVLEMIGITMLAGVLATACAVLIGFYSAVASYRLGLDPDNHGIPIVTSSLDLLGALSLIIAIVVFGLT